MLLDNRRLLDGGNEDGTILGSIGEGLSELGDSIQAAIGGVSQADVAAGAVDPATLSRSQRVSLAVDGAVPGFFERASPWSVALDFDPSITAAALVHGGIVLVVTANASVFDTLESKIFSPRFAFMWDDTEVAQAGVLDLAFTDSTVIVAQIGAPRGARLTLWMTEPDIVCSLVKTDVPANANAVRQGIITAAGAGDGPGVLDTFTKFFTGVFDLQKEAIILVAIVGGVVVYFLAKGELAAARGG